MRTVIITEEPVDIITDSGTSYHTIN